MKYPTTLLFLLTVVCGIGGSMLITFTDGFYGVPLLVAFPFVVALLFLSIVHDVSSEQRRGFGARSPQDVSPDLPTDGSRHPRAA